MNVLLVSPPSIQFEKMYPLTLGYISALLKQAGHKVVGIDLSFNHIDDCVELIKERRIDVVGILIACHFYDNVISAVKKIKRRYSIPLVAFGPHAALIKKEFINDQHCIIDYFILGEPEESFLEFINALERSRDLNRVAGLVWKNGQEIVQNPVRANTGSLDLLPFPDRALFPLKSYSGMICRNKWYTQVVTSRGCPHRCVYCFQCLAEPIRRERSPKNVVEEIEYLIRNYNVKEIHIEDANFIAGNSERVKDICREILRKRLRFDWQCAGVIPFSEIQDMSMLDLMAQAGCYNISIGIESFSKTITNRMGRYQTLNALPRIVECCRKNRMEVSCHLIIGFPGQSIEQIKEDINFSHRYPFDFIHYNILQEIPGTDLQKQNNQISRNKTRHYGYLSSLELRKIQRRAYLMLILKKSVMAFALRRLLKAHNTFFMFRKLFNYLFGARNVRAVYS